MKILENDRLIAVRNNQILSHHSFRNLKFVFVISSITTLEQQKTIHNHMNHYTLRSCRNFFEIIKIFNFNSFNLILMKNAIKILLCLTINVNITINVTEHNAIKMILIKTYNKTK